MKITVLAENRKSDACEGESGLSLYVELGEHKFLFDTGNSGLFLKNAEKLGVDADGVDSVIISHGHADHANGLEYLTGGKRVIMHPEGFKARFSPRRMVFVGFPYSEGRAKLKFDFTVTKEPIEVFSDVWFLGEIPRKHDFEGIGNISTYLDEACTEIDYIEDDTGIAIKTENGLFVISGCGHSGICNTIEHAKKVTGEQRIYGVLGGFHFIVPVYGKDDLAQFDDVVEHTIDYFKENNVQHAILGHCIKDETIDRFENELEGVTVVQRMFSGARIEVP
jgi:7,8-dihydropterin-6-yl-methyl-4-(beta-D-ribofuranosyl)aminobenzene 5'-phosphate synthase